MRCFKREKEITPLRIYSSTSKEIPKLKQKISNAEMSQKNSNKEEGLFIYHQYFPLLKFKDLYWILSYIQIGKQPKYFIYKYYS